ncbi:MAG: hypothetical protein ACRC6M_01160, partial [Microcystaceae cyanobacterium]
MKVFSSYFLFFGLILLTGCSGSPIAERLAVNPALQNSPDASPLPPSSPSLPLPPSPPISPSPRLPDPIASDLIFADLINISQPNRGYLENLAQLGIITAKSGQNFQGSSP